jgi:cystathionine beta-lyase/cystathionine gamma-synthase
MTEHAGQGLATRIIHEHRLEDAHGSPQMPVYDTTTFAFDSTAALLDVVDGRRAGALYTRYGLNPTIFALEESLAVLEQAEIAWAFCSGMAAEAALFLTHGRPGVVCIGDAYGGTLELVGSQLPELGIRTHLIRGDELDRLDGLLAGGAHLVFLETPTNPTLEIFDIRAIAAQAHARGALLAVDNTFASPVNQQPLALGADLVVHSATKYLGGHSDLTAGALMGSKELLAPVWNWRKNLGSMPAPATAARAPAERECAGGGRGDAAPSARAARTVSRPAGFPGICAGPEPDAGLRRHADDRGRRRRHGRDSRRGPPAPVHPRAEPRRC